MNSRPSANLEAYSPDLIDDKDLDDIHKEVVEDEQKVLEKKRKLIIGASVILVMCIIAAAVILPLTLMRKPTSSSTTKELHTAAFQPEPVAPVEAEDMSSKISAANIKSSKHDEKKSKSKSKSETRLITPKNQESSDPPEYVHTVSPYSKLTRLRILEPAQDSRVFVMGDIHGCLEEMNALVEKINFQPNKDVLILSGDLVFKGEESIGVIRRARELGAYCVRGNHDDKVVRLKSYELEHGVHSMGSSDEIMPEGAVGDPLKFGNKHLAVAKLLNKKDYNYLVDCPLILDIPSLNARVVHGGLDPSIPNLVDNDPWSVMNMRDIDSDNQPSKLKLNKKPDSDVIHWTEHYQSYSDKHHSNTTIYYGHDASRGAYIGKQTVGVDSGCVYGRQLSVVEMRTKTLTQINCRERVKNEHSDDE